MIEIMNTLEKEINTTGASRELESNLKIDKNKREYSTLFTVYINSVPIKVTSDLSEAYNTYESIELSEVEGQSGIYSYSAPPLSSLPEVDLPPLTEGKIITELFTLMNNTGQFMRAKGFSGSGKSWVDGIKTARIYTSIGPAKAQVTYWNKNFPNHECPKIVVLEATIKEVLDQSDRVSKAIERQKRDRANYEKKSLENKISSLTNKLNQLKQRKK